MYESATRAEMQTGEQVIARFGADRATYIRDHVVMAVVLSLGAMVVLHFMGEVWWVGAPAACAAIAVRGVYLASEDMHAYWELTNRRLIGPQGRQVWLSDVTALRHLGSAIQIITSGGDKHLMKYLADKHAARDTINRHMTGGME